MLPIAEAKPVSTKHLDCYIDTKLKQEGIKPSKQSKDAEFLRRLHLDLTGTIPTVDEVQNFLKDRSKDKREKKINQLIGSDPYLDYWSGLWSKWLIGRIHLSDSTDHKNRGSSLNQLLKATRYPAQRVEQLYLRTFSRPQQHQKKPILNATSNKAYTATKPTLTKTYTGHYSTPPNSP